MYQRILFRSISLAVILLVAGLAPAQERKSRIHLDSYVIDADINQRTQSLAGKAAARFTPLDDGTTSVGFELNNALNIPRCWMSRIARFPTRARSRISRSI
jgi:hypothetical protein